MFLNASIPEFYCLARKEFFYNLERGFGEYVPIMVFGARSRAGRALEFHVMTDSGMQFLGLPVHALCSKPCDKPELVNVALWDCFGEEFTVTKFDFLEDLRCQYKSEDGKLYKGQYKMTFDWTNNAFSDEPSQRKNAHLIELDSGNYALQPNNRTLWRDPSFTIEKPSLDWKVNTHVFSSEKMIKREKGDDFFYN
jgi:hypothetical protein